jgi:hypothetical protein
MKKLAFILFFFVSAAQAQDYYTNDPVRAEVMMNGFLDDAEARGIEVRERLQSVDKILFIKNGPNDHKHTSGVCTIRIGMNPYESEEELMRKAYHELGHHFGLHHCDQCTYNIMATRPQDNNTVKLWTFGPSVRTIYLDAFFEQLRNPSEPHKHY